MKQEDIIKFMRWNKKELIAERKEITAKIDKLNMEIGYAVERYETEKAKEEALCNRQKRTKIRNKEKVG